ncbi:hypothetical protein JD844_001519 [Phrynosoma platyrhinos]|uniref:Uncharacterized protein n=1 Tax=Phrynosoma platyrhinos TaxID=52577 RepID=A0ABQ7T9U3_PHRPL|nr:hypothetical protein JD844_001519 [Phrynosoma platyrhinos]
MNEQKDEGDQWWQSRCQNLEQLKPLGQRLILVPGSHNGHTR